MSVTFTIEANTTGTFSASCYEQGSVISGVSERRAQEAVAEHKETCEECAHYGLFVTADCDVSDEFDVNLANTNARLMLQRLGLDESEDLCGGVSGETFLGAVLLVLGTLSVESDAVVPAAVLSSPGQATFIDCGTPEGYTSDRLQSLAALGTEAVRLGRDVVWA